MCIIFYSMHIIFALPGWHHKCIMRKEGVSHLGLVFRWRHLWIMVQWVGILYKSSERKKSFKIFTTCNILQNRTWSSLSVVSLFESESCKSLCTVAKSVCTVAKSCRSDLSKSVWSRSSMSLVWRNNRWIRTTVGGPTTITAQFITNWYRVPLLLDYFVLSCNNEASTKKLHLPLTSTHMKLEFWWSSTQE